MSATLAPSSSAGLGTAAELLRVMVSLGDIPPERVRLHPVPGTATEQDVLDADTHDNRICELIDGILVEKPMGMMESRLAMSLGSRITNYLDEHNVGFVGGEAGFLRLKKGLVRTPDVSVIRWDRIKDKKELKKQIPSTAPDLAVEILSPSNTRAEMKRKRREYFRAGTRLVWEIDPRKRTADVYTSTDDVIHLDDTGTLEGGSVLPGFRMLLKPWFDKVLGKD
jgi:Uma2 family endonuclease